MTWPKVFRRFRCEVRSDANCFSSPKDPARPQIEDLVPIEEEFRIGEGCQISRLTNCLVNSESHGFGGGKEMQLKVEFLG